MLNYAIILASGSGNRFGGETPKQFLKIQEKTILEHTVEAFESNKKIDRIIVVTNPEFITQTQNLLEKYSKIYKIITGGATRKDSSFNGVNSIEDSEANVLIHDCARPFIKGSIITNCIEALETNIAVAVAIPSTDTVIEVQNEKIKSIPKRENMMCIQTPQCFKLSLIKKAHDLAKNNTNFTDDCGLVINQNLADIKILEGDVENIKITYRSDIEKATQILNKRLEQC